MNKWTYYKNLGKEKEVEFAHLLVHNFGGTVTSASQSDDMFKHIDLYWLYNNRTYSFDVKSAKKVNRSDYTPTYDINWIELQNVRGNPGWLYGEADFIAFESSNYWFIVKRTDIIKLISSKVINTKISSNKDFYSYYQRYGRQDIVVKVPSKDLEEIARVKLDKR